MTLFVDTSALVKLYVDESGSASMVQLAEGNLVAVSHLAFAEAHATFARLRREGDVTPEEHDRLCARFAREWEAMLRVPVAAPVLAYVPDLCRRNPLRGGDAVQLASALLLRAERLDVRFACCDQRLLAAATQEGLQVVNPEEEAA